MKGMWMTRERIYTTYTLYLIIHYIYTISRNTLHIHYIKEYFTDILIIHYRISYYTLNNLTYTTLRLNNLTYTTYRLNYTEGILTYKEYILHIDLTTLRISYIHYTKT